VWFCVGLRQITIAVCCSDIQVLIENVLHLNCFYREWCEWYDLYGMWWSVCNICATCVLQVNTTGLRLFHYCITTYVSTCDTWSHVIHQLAIRCSSSTCFHGGSSQGWRRWWSSQVRMQKDGVHDAAMRMETTMILKGHTIQNLIWSYMCLWYLFSCLTILFMLYMWWIFCHDRITFPEKIRFWCHLPIAAIIEFWSLWGGFTKVKYPHL
jgi:hypothetical protein